MALPTIASIPSSLKKTLVQLGVIAALLMVTTKNSTFEQMKMAAAAMLISGSVNVLAILYMYTAYLSGLRQTWILEYYVTVEAGMYISILDL